MKLFQVVVIAVFAFGSASAMACHKGETPCGINRNRCCPIKKSADSELEQDLMAVSQSLASQECTVESKRTYCEWEHFTGESIRIEGDLEYKTCRRVTNPPQTQIGHTFLGPVVLTVNGVQAQALDIEGSYFYSSNGFGMINSSFVLKPQSGETNPYFTSIGNLRGGASIPGANVEISLPNTSNRITGFCSSF